ncbi:shikimate kinase [Paludisphaera mucosa]|uniref:Shikimate kinase n=1 Tax=Paludisphaera mucosa TaxID=3030827 RepID=A0ABT6F8E0_9BACT|nr:shikimate kinase [Paludisphaera mucosa]MDG3003640.1 shikimate kinase [Paludisphaera mucosa]
MSREPMGETNGGGLVLVGYRGTGKSTVGRLLAGRSGRPFVDVDDVIVARAGRTIRAIFEDSGEPAFRELEESVVRDLVATHPGAVLGTGGGTILREANRRALTTFGLVAWLRADADELARRLEADSATRETRPSLTSKGALEEIAEVLAVRTPFYQEIAQVVVDTQERGPAEVADLILRHWSPSTVARPAGEPHACS